MSAYDFDRVVEDCLKDKRMSKKTGGSVVGSHETRVSVAAELLSVNAVLLGYSLGGYGENIAEVTPFLTPFAPPRTKPNPQLYYSVWESYNNWLLDQMIRRKGADAAGFVNFSWEFYSKATNTDDSEAFQMRCRPAFVLADQFKKQNQLPKSKKHLPPTLAPSEIINFHKLALRYSNDLTKDMIFTTFRDLVRKIGEVIGSQKTVKLKFSVGTLHSRERKTRFEWDSEALKMQAGDNPIVFTMTKPLVTPAAPPPAVEDFEEMFGGGETSLPPQTEEEKFTEFAGTNAGAMNMPEGQEEFLDEDDLGVTGVFAVQEEAYERYIKVLEKDAEEEDKVNKLLVTMMEEKDTKLAAKKEAKKKKLKDLQLYQLEQMKRQMSEKEAEILDRKSVTATSFYPRTDKEGGVDAELASKIDNPFSVPVGRKFLGIPNVPKKGLGYRVSESELLSSLTTQINLKSQKKVEEKEMRLEEEKRYCDHIAMELDYDSQTKQLESSVKKQEMMAAWERDSFLKKMKSLRMKGDIEGLRAHHEEFYKSVGVGGKGGGSNVPSLPPLPVVSGNQGGSRGSQGFGGGEVGFDSRR
ncbi:hypothetical protein TrLO_g6970 [Triparma laevis f. longispina]|uniref:Uncharacterized protein n=1 Tax=Triparma laevis f. longispina TaxID=1714387 RepID=A0A9W7AK99_9STRA|nr:hypothetical protein TrLO_g6970 [Triparma laevis f. longispina]